MAERTKVLFLALDACDHRVIEHLAAHGQCPTLARLLDEAAVVPTVAPYGSFVSSTWVTLSTASQVGTHRYWNWVAYDPSNYHNRITSPTEAERPPFWEQLSDRGHRLAIFDIPHSELPPEDFNGTFVKEWGAHDRHSGPDSRPAGAIADLGAHPYGSRPQPDNGQLAPCDYTLREAQHRTIEEERQLFNLMMAGLQAKEAASTTLLREGPWDLYAATIGETHCVGHQLWHVHDVAHPRHDPTTRILIGDPVESVYKRADALLGEHLELVGADTAVYVLLSHGMQAHYDGDPLLDIVLDRLDTPTSVGLRTRVSRAINDLAPSSLSAPIRRTAAAALRRRVANRPPAPPATPRWRAERRFFQIPNNSVVSAVRFNLVGREPQGFVRPEEIERLTEGLRESLLELTNVDTGRPAVLAVTPSDQVLDRSPGDNFPDLYVEWDRSRPVERVWSPEVGTIEVPYEHWRTGDHFDRGMLLVRAPGVQPGRRTPLITAHVTGTPR